jgi:hypothetical protein
MDELYGVISVRSRHGEVRSGLPSAISSLLVFRQRLLIGFTYVVPPPCVGILRSKMGDGSMRVGLLCVYRISFLLDDPAACVEH